MANLIKLDLSGNEVCKVEDYRTKVFESLSQLQCLDGKDQDNQSVESDSDDGDEYGEENEAEQVEIPQHIIERLDPEVREKYEKGEISQAELFEFLNNGDDGADEEGEFEFDEEEGEESVDKVNADEDGEDGGCKDDCC